VERHYRPWVHCCMHMSLTVVSPQSSNDYVTLKRLEDEIADKVLIQILQPGLCFDPIMQH